MTEDWSLLTEKLIDIRIDGDKYQILEELGRGSYGCLFLGQCLVDNSYVAIKILSRKGLNDEQLKLQQLEIDIQLSLQHQNILKLDHVVQQEDYIFMIMELCDGGDLFEFVVNKQQQQDDIVKNTFIQILDAIEYMHTSHIYHRDIKLENILLQSTSTSSNWICKVADFGLATKDDYSMEFGCGSTTYLAPEHFGTEIESLNDNGVEEEYYNVAASDIWSLGILLLALIFGRNPWEEATLIDPSFAEYQYDPMSLKYQLFPELSNGLLELLQSILHLDPNSRPSATEIKQRFLQLDQLTVNYDMQEDEGEDVVVSPLDILPAQPNKSNKASYDSAIFSQSGKSWFDIVEEDEQLLLQNTLPPSIEKELVKLHHDDEVIFVHDQEQESWWL